MSLEQKTLLNAELIYHLQRLQRSHPQVAREASAIANTMFTNRPDLNAPKAVVEAYAALCLYQKHHPWLPPEMFARLKTWLNSAGADLE